MSDLILGLNDGRERVYINEHKDRYIDINLSDINLLIRFKEAYDKIKKQLKEKSDSMGSSNDLEVTDRELAFIKECDEFVREQIDYIFDYPVSEAVFGRTCSVTPIEGIPYAIRFLEAILPLLEQKSKSEYSKIQKYTKKYDKK